MKDDIESLHSASAAAATLTLTLSQPILRDHQTRQTRATPLSLGKKSCNYTRCAWAGGTTVTAQNQLQTSARTVIHEPVSCIVRSVSTEDSQTDGRINLGGAG